MSLRRASSREGVDTCIPSRTIWWCCHVAIMATPGQLQRGQQRGLPREPWAGEDAVACQGRWETGRKKVARCLRTIVMAAKRKAAKRKAGRAASLEGKGRRLSCGSDDTDCRGWKVGG